MGENDFYHPSQEFDGNVFDNVLVKKNGFFPMDSGVALKRLKKTYSAKINFIVHWLIVQLAIKIMNMFWTF